MKKNSQAKRGSRFTPKEAGELDTRALYICRSRYVRALLSELKKAQFDPEKRAVKLAQRLRVHVNVARLLVGIHASASKVRGRGPQTRLRS